MNITLRRPSFQLNLPVIGVVGFAVFMALLSGLMSAFIPWYLTLLVLSPPVLVWAGWRWPVFALAGTLGVVYGVIPMGRGKLVDLVAGLFIVFMLLVRRGDIRRAWNEHRALWVLLGLFLSYVAVNIVYSKFYRGNGNNYIFMEAATVLYWAMLVPSALLARDRDAANFLLKLLVSISVLLCVTAVAQSLFSIRLNFSGVTRVSQIDGNTGGGDDLLRSIVPGLPLVMFSYFMALAAILRKRGVQWGWLVVLMASGLGIFASYGRALWAATVLGSALVAWASGRRAVFRLLAYATLLLSMAIPALVAFKPTVAMVALNRVTSIFQEGATNSSVGWRITENSYAIPQILNSPVLGMGLGAEYKPVVTDLRLFSEQTHYIHNGYLYLLLKLGSTGFVLNALLIVFIAYLCLRRGDFRRLSDTPKVAMGVMLGMILILNFSQPELFTSASVFSLALLLPVVLKSHLEWKA